MDRFETPILFIIFNRPDTTGRVFDVIKKLKPKYLFVAADGPRSDVPGEYQKCKFARSIVDRIDWNCEVKTLFRSNNLGMKKAVSESIDWFFEYNDQGIILEDDCLPSISFFSFCEAMLNKYKDNQRVMHVSGNFFQPNTVGNSSYYFSRIPHIWGWATWRRAWQKYDLEMNSYHEFIKSKKINNIFKGKKERILWKHLFDQVYYRKSDTWDFQWTYALFSHNGLAVTPNKNLVTNIGFGDLAENCKDPDDRFANLELENIDFPLVSPENILPDKEADYYISMNNFGFSNLKYILLRLRLFNIFQIVYRKIQQFNIKK